MEQLEIPAPLPPPRVQFGLKTILAITSAIALLFAAGAWLGPLGYVAFFLLAGLAAIFAFSRDFRSAVLHTLLYLLIVFVAFCMLLPAVRTSPLAARRSQCRNNLKQIGLGLQNYAEVYGCFPPAYVSDKNGKPMHSWRVLILPFIEQQALYDQYHFDEPWDGPNNSLLAKQMPAAYRCPSDAANSVNLTDYVAIVGPETVWQPNHGTTFKEIRDGTSNTIAIIEAADAGIHWMAPRDLPFAAVSKGINPKQGTGISSMHPGCAIALFADGHTQAIQENITQPLLRALCTKAGGEEVPGDF